MDTPVEENDLSHRPLELGGFEETVESVYQHWHAHRDQHDYLWLILDQAEHETNVLSEEVLEELDSALRAIQSNPPAAMVIRSAKHNGFVYGADISEFVGVTDKLSIVSRVKRGQKIFQALEDFPCPTIALIHGQCLGGGLELALVCDFRIARTDAQLGLPEVQLGMHPGLGGTARLPRTIAADEALRMMLSGKAISASKGKSLGLVDAVCEERHFAKAVHAAAQGNLKSRAGGVAVSIYRSLGVRQIIAAAARRETKNKLRPEHYPAPFRLIDLWEEHGGATESLLRAESSSFAKLLSEDTAQNLIRVFMLRKRLREQANPSSEQSLRVAPIRHVHIIGAGTMGGDIGAWCALQGLNVTLEDVNESVLEPTMARALKLFREKSQKKGGDLEAWDRLLPDIKGAGRSRADLVIEAIPEQLELKRELYAELEPQLKANAILASNTSSIPLDSLASVLKEPERFVGIHFFNPVSRMKLVELIKHEQLADNALARALSFARTIDRLPVVARNAPGFLVNRVLTPYLLEAMVLVGEGNAPELIDAAAEDFGMPVGPIELADQIGLDICLAVAESLAKNLDEPQPAIPHWLRKKTDSGDLGKKTGEGIYKYKKGKASKADKEGEIKPGLRDRLILPMLNTCMQCLSANVVKDAETLDAAMIFGTGFAPFRGGPMHYAGQRGYEQIAAALEELEQHHGERFRPDPGWRNRSGDR